MIFYPFIKDFYGQTLHNLSFYGSPQSTPNISTYHSLGGWKIESSPNSSHLFYPSQSSAKMPTHPNWTSLKSYPTPSSTTGSPTGTTSNTAEPPTTPKTGIWIDHTYSVLRNPQSLARSNLIPSSDSRSHRDLSTPIVSYECFYRLLAY